MTNSTTRESSSNSKFNQTSAKYLEASFVKHDAASIRVLLRFFLVFRLKTHSIKYNHVPHSNISSSWDTVKTQTPPYIILPPGNSASVNQERLRQKQLHRLDVAESHRRRTDFAVEHFDIHYLLSPFLAEVIEQRLLRSVRVHGMEKNASESKRKEA